MPQLQVRNQIHPFAEPLIVDKCDTFFTRLRGFMFQSGVARQAGLLFYQDRENRLDSAIHMFFVNFDLGVLWLDPQRRVVDRLIARRWRPYYAPSRPAKYILEIHPDRLKDFQIGDTLDFEDF